MVAPADFADFADFFCVTQIQKRIYFKQKLARLCKGGDSSLRPWRTISMHCVKHRGRIFYQKALNKDNTTRRMAGKKSVPSEKSAYIRDRILYNSPLFYLSPTEILNS